MSTRQMVQAAVLAAIYVVVGQVVRFIPNPMVPGAIIALNMVVVVIAGILLGPAAGASVGFLGTLVNALSPSGNAFEWAAVIPHTIMGLTAGVVGRRSVVFGALTVIVGHALNILAFLVVRLLPMNQLAVTIFSIGLLVEVVIDVVVIVITVPLLRPLTKTG